jgi:hypothetical protein
MKKIKTFIVILVSLFWIHGCSPDVNLVAPDLSIDQILGGKEMVVYKGMLTFKDKTTFDNLTSDFIKRDEAFIRTWEKQLGFKSLYSTYEDVIDEEDKFLEQMVKKYGADSEVTRDEMGYSKMTQKYLESGSLIISNDGFLDMNVTVPSLAPLINAEGFVRVGNEIRQYKTDFVKIILDGDYNKMNELAAFKESTQNIHVGVVERQLNKISDSKRTQALSSCDTSIDRYRTIAYEEKTVANIGGSPCEVYENYYYIKMRSLKKTLGSWYNHDTGFLAVSNSSFTLVHLNCDLTFKRNVMTCSGCGKSGQYGHTIYYYYVERYDTGPCTSVSPTFWCTQTPGTMVFSGISPGRSHTAKGKNDTSCTLGH